MSDQHRELVLEGDQVVSMKDAPKRWTAKVEARPRYSRDTGEREPDVIMCYVLDEAECSVALVYGPDGDIAARAHLMAAAPELLAACKAALAWFEDEARSGHDEEAGPFDETKIGTLPAALREAVAKAEGRE